MNLWTVWWQCTPTGSAIHRWRINGVGLTSHCSSPFSLSLASSCIFLLSCTRRVNFQIQNSFHPSHSFFPCFHLLSIVFNAITNTNPTPTLQKNFSMESISKSNPIKSLIFELNLRHTISINKPSSLTRNLLIFYLHLDKIVSKNALHPRQPTKHASSASKPREKEIAKLGILIWLPVSITALLQRFFLIPNKNCIMAWIWIWVWVPYGFEFWKVLLHPFTMETIRKCGWW